MTESMRSQGKGRAMIEAIQEAMTVLHQLAASALFTAALIFLAFALALD